MPTENINRWDSVPGRKVKAFLDNKNVMQTENPNNWDSEPRRKVKVFLDQKVR